MLAILQARMNSSRLPGKVMELVNGTPVILWQIERIVRASLVSDLVIATTDSEKDDILCELLEKNGVAYHRGDESNVLSRFCAIIERYGIPWIVRLTGDCPLFMPSICDQIIEVALNSQNQFDCVSNTIVPTFPDGCDVEVVKSESLLRLSLMETSNLEKEHVTFGMYQRRAQFNCLNFYNEKDQSKFRWTLDTAIDLEFVRRVYDCFKGREVLFSYADVMNEIEKGTIPPLLDDGSLRNQNLRK
jgi:spore coat polysaccharide biosynthesis protein SpsF